MLRHNTPARAPRMYCMWVLSCVLFRTAANSLYQPIQGFVETWRLLLSESQQSTIYHKDKQINKDQIGYIFFPILLGGLWNSILRNADFQVGKALNKNFPDKYINDPWCFLTTRDPAFCWAVVGCLATPVITENTLSHTAPLEPHSYVCLCHACETWTTWIPLGSVWHRVVPSGVTSTHSNVLLWHSHQH